MVLKDSDLGTRNLRLQFYIANRHRATILSEDHVTVEGGRLGRCLHVATRK